MCCLNQSLLHISNDGWLSLECMRYQQYQLFLHSIFVWIKGFDLFFFFFFYPHAQADPSQMFLSLLLDYIALLIPGGYFVSSLKAY